MDSQISVEDIKKLISEGNIQKLENILNAEFPFELADLLTATSKEELYVIFNILSPRVAVRAFTLLPFSRQKEILYSLTSTQAAGLLNEMPPDDRTTFFEELPSTSVNELIKLLSPIERMMTLKLLGYPEDSVGRLMTPDYITIRYDWTVKQVLDHIRQFGRDSETISFIYITDNQGILIDDIRIREFFFASPEAKVKDISDRKFISLLVTDDYSKAINVFTKNNRSALPVTDSKGVLLGIVTIDDILKLTEEVGTEDIQKIGGMEALDEPYMSIPFLKLMQKRVGWLVILFIGEMFTASAMGYFENEISRAVVLALFLPLIISSGGNSGSQASSLIIRSLALGEVKLIDWWKVMRREIFSGIFLGTVLGVIGFFRVTIWSQFTELYGPHWLLLGYTVALALLGVVMWGSLMGAMLPLLLKRLGADPATSSAPFVATLVDVTGIVIYFGIALLILHGTLL